MTPKGNQNALKHGGEAAIKRIQAGKPLSGLAFEAEQAVIAELQTAGIEQIVKRDAIQIQSVADLFLNVVIKTAQDGNIAALDGYIGRWGWLQGAALRAWAQVKANEKDAARSNNRYVDAIQAMKGGQNDED